MAHKIQLKLRFMPRQKGMALIAVLWITAALSLLAMSLSQMARTDLRVVEVFKQTTEAQARADGALTVAADWLQGQISTITGTRILKVNVAGVLVAVHIVPAAGFININMAPPDLLRDMFVIGAGLPRNQAALLAQRVVRWRTAENVQGAADDDAAQYRQSGLAPPRHGPFRTQEDIRQVLGVTPAIYAKISPLIVANTRVVSSLVDPAAAPPGVLQVLAGGKEAIVRRILAARAQRVGENASSMQPVDYSGLNPTYLESVGSTYFRLTAFVHGSGDLLWQRNWWVDFSSMRMQSITPWKVMQTEPLRSAVFG